MAGGGGVPAGMQGGGPGAALNYILPRALGNNFTPGQPFIRQAGDPMAQGKGPGTSAQQTTPGPSGAPGQLQSLVELVVVSGGSCGSAQCLSDPESRAQEFRRSPQSGA